MMNVRPLLLSTVAAAALSLMAAAPGVRPHHAGFMHAVHNLGLSAGQRSQIQSLMQQYRQDHPKGSAPDKEARKALRQHVLSVLTPQQREQLKDEMQQMRSEQHPGGFGPTPSPLPEETSQP
ncbi:MAG TPA: hypothetical protein VFL13_06170 [Candidatus Baltobacteraceae bacterium]|nr:hypothetical protein [Candidatus Baltobacteraceae bacterium]